MMLAGQRLRALRLRAGLSIRAAATELGFKSPGSYQYYEESDASSLPTKFVEKLVAFVGKGDPPIEEDDIYALASSVGSAIVNSNASDFQAVPIYDIRASAGAGALVEDGEPTAYQPYREAEIARYNIESLAVIQVGGDSMWETLHDGDKVLVDRSIKRIVRPGIYILGYEGELIVKRCQRNLETGAVIVQSDNPDYETFTVTDADRLDVLGRVVWIGRSIG